MGVFGTIGFVLPFLGRELVLLAALGAYAQYAALILLLVGWCMYAGAYLSRMRWCSGKFAALKIGGVLTAGVTVVLVFLFGALVLGLLAKDGLKHSSSSREMADSSPPPRTYNPPANSFRPASPPMASPQRFPPSRAPDNVTDAFAAAADSVNSQTPNSPQMAMQQLQMQLAPPPQQRAPYGKGPNDLTILVTGLDKVDGEHGWRNKELLNRLTRMQDQGPDRGWQESGSADDRFVKIVLRPVNDVQAAIRAIDFGTATVSPSEPRNIRVVIDPLKFPKQNS